MRIFLDANILFSAAVQSVKALGELVKAAKQLSNYTEFVSAVSEVSTKLMAATAVALASQEKQAALASRVGDLEKELVQIKDWEAEANNYEVLEVARGLFAYVAKGNVQPLHSAHKLCSNCFLQYKKSFLQESRDTAPPRHYALSCDRCGSKRPFHFYTDNS